MPTVTVAPLVFSPDSKLSDRKVALRASMRVLRRDLVDQQGPRLAEQLAEQAELFAVPRSGAVVAGYWPLAYELDPRPLLWRLWGQGWNLALPVVTAKDHPLSFRRYRPDDPLEPGAFGVSHPLATAEVVRPDLVLVPLLAFDRHGHRLGYGGGFYDRTLAHLRQSRTIRAIGLALPQQECPSVPTEPTDQPLDAILTPTGWM